MLPIFHGHSFIHLLIHSLFSTFTHSKTTHSVHPLCKHSLDVSYVPGHSGLRQNQQGTRELEELEGTLVVKNQGLRAQEMWVLHPGSTTD